MSQWPMVKLYDKVEAIRGLQTQTSAGRKGMLPPILDRAFKGALQMWRARVTRGEPRDRI